MSAPHSTHQRAKWLSLSILYVVLFTFPFLRIFNHNTPVLGVPLLTLYLLFGWLLFIFVIYRFTRRLNGDDVAGDAADGEERERP